jgi:hypothetical protein
MINVSQPMDNDLRNPDDVGGYLIYKAQPGDLAPMYIRNGKSVPVLLGNAACV